MKGFGLRNSPEGSKSVSGLAWLDVERLESLIVLTLTSSTICLDLDFPSGPVRKWITEPTIEVRWICWRSQTVTEETHRQCNVYGIVPRAEDLKDQQGRYLSRWQSFPLKVSKVDQSKSQLCNSTSKPDRIEEIGRESVQVVGDQVNTNRHSRVIANAYEPKNTWWACLNGDVNLNARFE